MIELMIQVFIEVRVTYSGQKNELPAVGLYVLPFSHLLSFLEDKVKQPASVNVPSSMLIMTHLKKEISDGKIKNSKILFSKRSK